MKLVRGAWKLLVGIKDALVLVAMLLFYVIYGLVFAAYSLLLAVIFALFFRYQHEPEKLINKALTH